MEREKQDRAEENKDKNIYSYFISKGENPEEIIKRAERFIFDKEEELRLKIIKGRWKRISEE